ncbi:MAG: hypothetical protein KFF77_06865 [Bacteroidetes bacterium]|nr:hypothetical protein [Bacteroidota bacterium]
MKTQYYIATSLEGFIATDDDSLDWLFQLGDLEESSDPGFIAEVGALAMVSSTYEWMLRNAAAVVAETGAGKPLFPRRVNPPALRLHTVRQMGAGVVELRYEVVKGGGVE